MSGKGGAGKVYFILYLAVLLELLIIIVERDDAEDELRKEKIALEQKSKRIQLIAETIINSLRGSATSVSSTSNQSMIIGDEKEADGREFSVRVRVADPAKDSVKELDLHILRNDQEMKSINLATDTVLYPRTRIGQDYTFKYKFKPEFGEGEYKLRFDAKTNQIVGVAAQHSEDDTVKIGAIHLTVKELKEVKDNITENIQLRGYLDSLLGGQYENFATNIGSNEFVVNVKKKAAQVFDQLSVFPQESNFAAFPGLELPNPVKIEGAEAKVVKIDKVDGPGEFVKVDTNWVWKWKPDASMVGQTYTVKFKGTANREGGAEKNLAGGTFSVSVNKLEQTANAFFPVNKAKAPTPYTGIPFRFNGKYQGLDGTYKVELLMDGAKVVERNEPNVEFQPELLKDEKKKLQIKTYFKSTFMKEFLELYDTTLTIQPPPLKAGPDADALMAGDALDFKAALGIAGVPYIQIGGDLDVESDGFFDKTARKGKDFQFSVRMTSKANNLPKAGKDVDVRVIDPRTGQSATMTIHIDPKTQQKGANPLQRKM
jgi:hypothetical protein